MTQAEMSRAALYASELARYVAMADAVGMEGGSQDLWSDMARRYLEKLANEMGYAVSRTKQSEAA